MRVVPAQGMVLRDPRTRRLVDADLGVEVDPLDVTFAWLLSHGDCVELSEADYTAALARREAEEKAAAAETALEAIETPAAAPPRPPKGAPDQGADA